MAAKQIRRAQKLVGVFTKNQFHPSGCQLTLMSEPCQRQTCLSIAGTRLPTPPRLSCASIGDGHDHGDKPFWILDCALFYEKIFCRSEAAWMPGPEAKTELMENVINRACPVCDEPASTPFLRKLDLQLVRCARC